MPRTTPKLPALLLGLPLLLAACAAPAAEPPEPSDTPHGYVAGAQENPEPQTGLLTFNAGTGKGQLRSLLTDETSDAGTYGPLHAATRDGRYALLTTADGVEVFDTGAWTVDHGEHKHYYSADPRPVGTLAVPDAGAVAGDGAAIAVVSGSGGHASVFRHKDLDAGTVTEAFRITTSPHSGVVVPFEGHFATSVASAPGSTPDGVEVRSAGDAVVLGQQDCPGLSGHARTRVGLVFTCSDGALLVTEDGGAFATEKIPYPDGGARHPHATSLGHRPGSNELGGAAGDAGIWHLDVSKRAWTFLATPVPALAASAVGDGKRVLAIGADGSLLTLNPATGAVTAREALLSPAGGGAEPKILVDTSRAYVSDPARSVVLEVDYAGGLRTARTFPVPAADLVLETGL